MLSIQKAREEFKRTWDITITNNLLHLIEWWETNDFFKHIINNSIISSYKLEQSNEKKLALIKYINQWNIKIWIGRGIIDWDIELHSKKTERRNWKEILTDTKYKFFCGHAYSIERVYHDSTTNKDMVVIVNPRNTSEKIHITVEECTKIFTQRSVTTINVSKIFN